MLKIRIASKASSRTEFFCFIAKVFNKHSIKEYGLPFIIDGGPGKMLQVIQFFYQTT